MLIFGCPVGVRIHQKTFRNHVPINYDIHTTKNHQNISKNLPKTAPNPGKMGGVELSRSTSDQKGTPKTRFTTNITPKYIQNGAVGVTKTVINRAPDHEIGQVKLQPQLWDYQKAFETSPKALGQQ